MKALAQEYKAEGIKLMLLVGSPVKLALARNYVKSQVPLEELFLMAAGGFWILEGLIIEYEVDQSKYPTLYKYLEEREGFGLPRRWKHYLETIQDEDLEVLRVAYEGTRKSIFETLADVPLEEKKS